MVGDSVSLLSEEWDLYQKLISSSLYLNEEKIGEIKVDDLNSYKNLSPEKFTSFDEFYKKLTSLKDEDSSNFYVNKKITFNENFNKYNKNRVVEFNIFLSEEKEDLIRYDSKKNPDLDKIEKLKKIKKEFNHNIYFNKKEIKKTDIKYDFKLGVEPLQDFSVTDDDSKYIYDENSNVSFHYLGTIAEIKNPPAKIEKLLYYYKVLTKENIARKTPTKTDSSREKGQENITVKGKDGNKTTTTTYTVNPKTGEVVETVGKPVVVEPTETVIKVAAKDKVEVVNKKDGETIKITTSYEVNPKTGEIKEVKREDLLSKKGIPEVSEESTEFKGEVNPTESIVRKDLPELKVAIIKDKENNILDVIKEDEESKEIKGYKNTGKTEVDKDGHKVYIYEKVEESKSTPKENKVENTSKEEDNKENKKEVISKKEELPKTSTSMLSTVGLFSIFGLRKNRKKDK